MFLLKLLTEFGKNLYMLISKQELITLAKQQGYRPEILEKVLWLLDILEKINELPFLKNKFVLKGGTALNLFHFHDLPRLSVDIDLNYIGSPNKEIMLQERQEIEQAIILLAQGLGMELYRHPCTHAGGKMVFRYNSLLGQKGNLDIDLNYIYRIPLFDVSKQNSTNWPRQIKNIPILDINELAAGKFKALFDRVASRDLFDSYTLLTSSLLDMEKLRLAFVVYSAVGLTDWQNISVDKISFELKDLSNKLIPVLRQSVVSSGRLSGLEQWAKQITADTRRAFQKILPFTNNEKEFLSKLQEQGEINPRLICSDMVICDRISNHPALNWKILKNSKVPGASLMAFKN